MRPTVVWGGEGKPPRRIPSLILLDWWLRFYWRVKRLLLWFGFR
jgi:hypothetical protein